jgi:hypothetical protein
MRLSALLAGLVLGTGVAGAATVAPEVFEAMSEGRTLHFTHDGQVFGAERYFPGRRALWRYADGTCAWGRWFPRDGLICFEYEGAAGPQCWSFQGDGTGFSAALVQDGAPTGLLIHMSGVDDRPLDCPGPRAGS